MKKRLLAEVLSSNTGGGGPSGDVDADEAVGALKSVSPQATSASGAAAAPPPPVLMLPSGDVVAMASNVAPRRYNLRIVTDIAIVGPRTLVTLGHSHMGPLEPWGQ